MSKVCQLSQKKPQSGNRVSHSKAKTRHKFLPNLQKKRCWSDDLQKFVSLRLSASALRTVDKIGLDNYAKKASLKLS